MGGSRQDKQLSEDRAGDYRNNASIWSTVSNREQAMVRNVHPNPYDNLGEDDWWHPQDLSANQVPSILSASQVDQFRHDGFVVVTGLWPVDLIMQAAVEARELHPFDDVVDARGGFSEMPWVHKREDAPDVALNHMTIHSRALAAVSQLMERPVLDLRLSQSHVIAKYGHQISRPGEERDGTIAGDQDIHVDYGNNTLMVPPHRTRAEAVACLCYYSDVDEAGGATHFAKAQPGELTTYEPKRFNPPNFVIGTENGSAGATTGPRSPEKTERRYREERPVRYEPGSCILYRLNAWHRGTPAALGKVRYTHHHVWRYRAAEWVNWQSLAPRMSQMPTRYLSVLSVEQRTVLGFAAPGDPYWSEETLDSVGQRYPEMDMTPYREAIAG